MIDIKAIHKELKRLGFSFNGGRNCRFYWNSDDMWSATERVEFQADRMSGGWFSFGTYTDGLIDGHAYEFVLKEVKRDYIVVGYPDDNILDVTFTRVKHGE